MRGPYNKSKDASQASQANNSEQKTYVRGPYKKRNISSNMNDDSWRCQTSQIQDSISSFEDVIKRSRRAPVTRKVLKRDFPTAQQNMLASQTSQTKDMGLQEVQDLASAGSQPGLIKL